MSKHFNFKDRKGEKYITNQGYEIEIIDYIASNNCTIKFNDKLGTIKYKVAMKEIKSGGIFNAFHKSKYGVGYLGEGKYCSSKSKIEQLSYDYWDGFFRRCYNQRVITMSPSYKGCSVSEEWHNFQNFGEWFDNNYNHKTMEGWCLDKDILFKGNKIYSPETCCFVPNEVNVVLTSSRAKRGDLPIGVCKKGNRYRAQIKTNSVVRGLGTYDTPKEAFDAYKMAKEIYIKELAFKWKELISNKVYIALINYEVEITD
jgi:hypothetical protein